LLNDWPGRDAGFGPLVYRFGLLRGLCAGEFVRINSSAPPHPAADASVDRI
jgi:hypothetical protein